MKDGQPSGADSRRTRSRQGLASAAVVSLAAAVIVVGPHWLDGSPVSNTAADGASGTQASSGTSELDPYAEPCPAAPVTVSDPPHVDNTLPSDAVLVRLCRARAGGVTSDWRAPADGLVHHVDRFAARLADLPPAPAAPCPAARVTPSPFALQITDSSGRTATLSSALTRCGTVTVNSHRVAADALLRAFRESLLQQRRALRTSSHPSPR